MHFMRHTIFEYRSLLSGLASKLDHYVFSLRMNLTESYVQEAIA